MWKEILQKFGYSIKYSPYKYWKQVPYAVKDNERFPLATTIVKNNILCLVTIEDIIASESNFYKLKWAAEDNCPLELRWINNGYNLIY